MRPGQEGDTPDGFAADLGALLARWGGTGPVTLHAALLPTPLGGMLAVCDDHAVRLLEFTSRPVLEREMRALTRATGGRIAEGRTGVTEALEVALRHYFDGAFARAEVPLAPLGTPFQTGVWQELRRLPPGATIRYADLAARIGRPEAVRAVAAANGANPVAILIPCHRIVGSDGSLTGYGGGLWRKAWLLRHESPQGADGESLDAGRFSA